MRKILVEHNTTVLADTIYATDPEAQLQQIKVVYITKTSWKMSVMLLTISLNYRVAIRNFVTFYAL